MLKALLVGDVRGATSKGSVFGDVEGNVFDVYGTGFRRVLKAML